jgi:hypothetical protein
MILWTRQRSKVRDEQPDIFERRLLVFLEPEAEPAGGEAAVAVRLFPRDQRRQLERLGDRHAADLSAGHLGEYEVVVLRSDPRCRLSYGRRHGSETSAATVRARAGK